MEYVKINGMLFNYEDDVGLLKILEWVSLFFSVNVTITLENEGLSVNTTVGVLEENLFDICQSLLTQDKFLLIGISEINAKKRLRPLNFFLKKA